MTKRIEEELIEMNRLKRLELEFLFFKTRMDETMRQKFRKALTNENMIHEDIDTDLQYVCVHPDHNHPSRLLEVIVCGRLNDPQLKTRP
jgi:hypothetical protein